MDPLSVASAVAGVTAACYTTAKTIHDLQGRFKDVPTTIISISSEMTVITASLAHIQGILLQRRDLADDGLDEIGHQRIAALDTSLTGCLVLFSCLDQEVATINKSRSKDGQLTWLGRARFLINNDRLQELLVALRGQQMAISLLIQLIQTDTISEIRKLLLDNKPTIDATIQRSRVMRASLRSSGRSVAESVLGRVGSRSIFSQSTSTDAYSNIAPSDIEFDFDDVVVNSRIYRRAMAAAGAARAGSTAEEEDSVDESPSALTIRAAERPRPTKMEGDAMKETKQSQRASDAPGRGLPNAKAHLPRATMHGQNPIQVPIPRRYDFVRSEGAMDWSEQNATQVPIPRAYGIVRAEGQVMERLEKPGRVPIPAGYGQVPITDYMDRRNYTGAKSRDHTNNAVVVKPRDAIQSPLPQGKQQENEPHPNEKSHKSSSDDSGLPSDKVWQRDQPGARSGNIATSTTVSPTMPIVYRPIVKRYLPRKPVPRDSQPVTSANTASTGWSSQELRGRDRPHSEPTGILVSNRETPNQQEKTRLRVSSADLASDDPDQPQMSAISYPGQEWTPFKDESFKYWDQTDIFHNITNNI